MTPAPNLPSCGNAPQPVSKDFLAPDGQNLRFWVWSWVPGRPVIHWAHATGFNARTYLPLLDRLSQQCNVVAWDMRGHGESRDAGRPETFAGWPTYYDDLAAWLRANSEPVWLAGHSIGATTSLAAANLVPEKVQGLILCDPVLLPNRWRLLLAMTSPLGLADRLGLAAGARRRRERFADHASVFASFRAKAAFAGWSDEWLWAYIRTGFTVVAEGGVRLACSPTWESATFAATEYRIWKRVRRLARPTLVLRGERASTFGASQFGRLRQRLPGVTIKTLPGTTHYLPMERTDDVANHILEWMFDRARQPS